MAAVAHNLAFSPSVVRFGCATQTTSRPVAGKYNEEGHDRDKHIPQEESVAKRLCERMIRWYQNNDYIHKKLYPEVGIRCLYAERGEASCSQYTLESIRKNGVIKGCVKGFLRIANCNPRTQKHEKLRKLFVEA